MKRHPNRPLHGLRAASLLLLTACGGGGALVRGDPPPPSSPTPPPPTGSAAPHCPEPIASDCVVDVISFETSRMTGGRQSGHALVKRGPGGLDLMEGDYRFGGGTRIEGGNLYIADTLLSNVTVLAPARFSVGGTVAGSVTNHGNVEIWGTVTGDVVNHGIVVVSATTWGSDATLENAVRGDFRQSLQGTLISTIPQADTFFGLLKISGRADLDGTLQLQQYSDDWGPYPLPTAPLTAHVLHAGGGVFGQFARWTSPGLFIEGSVRYGSHDVWFDLSRLSLASTMAASAAADSMTLASAANIDAALVRADTFAQAPAGSLGVAQQRFLASASGLLRARDVAGAARSLDSLSGQGHALVRDVLQAQAQETVAQLDAHLDRLPRGSLQGGAWSAPLAQGIQRGGSHSLQGRTTGFDQWLGPHWLLGGSVGKAESHMQFDRMGGHAIGTTSQASVYAHYRSDHAHATVMAGATGARLHTGRMIDLGPAGGHPVFARRALSQAFAHGEVARRAAIGAGQWTPYIALDYAVVRSDRFEEQGNTGFELHGQSARNGHWSASIGGRYARDWTVRGGRLGFTLDARYQRLLSTDGDGLQAAFAGVPDTGFPLQAWPGSRHGGGLGVGLTRDFDDGWTWLMDYRAAYGNQARSNLWGISLQRAF